MPDKQRIKAKVQRLIGRLSEHVRARYGLPERTAIVVAARTLWEIASLLDAEPRFVVPSRLLLKVLRRRAMDALEVAAVGHPELRELCRLAAESRDRSTRRTSRRAARRLARATDLPALPSREVEESLRRQLDRLDRASRDADWRSSVLAVLDTVDQTPVTPWVHPDSGEPPEDHLRGALETRSPKTRHSALVALGAMEKISDSLLQDVRRLARTDPDAGVRMAAREILWRRGLTEYD